MSMNSSTFHQVDSKPPPPAPPLPPQRYGQRAATAFARLAHPFLYGSRPSSAQGHRETDARPTGYREPVPQSSSSLSSRNVTHRTGIPINALDISPERTHVVLAGRDILKTVRVNDTTCAEDFNLRANITAYASAHNASRDAVSAQHRDQLTANDVKWSHKLFNTTIATAATSGRIVIYDINRPSIEIARLHEHARQVHKLAFNPHQGALLLSGSQDGTIRMWDLRALQGDKSVRVTGSIKRFFGNSEGVRDVRWSPTDGVEFAAGTDSGVVQRWDFRRESAPLLKLNAHDKACHSIDWHPSGKFLASAGGDKQVKVWDFKSTDRRMKPYWHLRASQSVLNARWRPVDLSGDVAANSPAVTQLATSYVGKDPRIHVWDFNRPNVPCQEFDRHEAQASDILWHSEDRLWSVGASGMFVQTDMTSIPNPLDRQNVNVISTAPDGKIFFFSEPRTRRRISLAEAEESFLQHSDTAESSGDNFSNSLSATEGSLEETSVLSTSLPARRQKSVSSRSVQNQPTSAARDPPFREVEGTPKELVTLDPTFQTKQIAACGHILGIFDTEAFKYLARNCSVHMLDNLRSDIQLPTTMLDIFEHNAVVAAQTGQYRLSQTWRIIGLAAQRALELRAETHKNNKNAHIAKSGPHSGLVSNSLTSGHSKPEQNGDIEGKSVPHFLQPTMQADSTSNVATPLARPVHELSSIPTADETMLDDQSHLNRISDGTSIWQLQRPSIKPQQTLEESQSTDPATWLPVSPKSHSQLTRDNDSGTTSPMFENVPDTDEQLEKRRNALIDYRRQPKSVLRLDHPHESSQQPGIPFRVERHDSNESFQMFSASVESDPRSLPLVGSFADSQRSDASDQAAASLSTSMRQDLANSILSRHIPLQQEQRRPSFQLPTSFQPPAILERKDSVGLERASDNAKVHERVRRPSVGFAPKIYISRNHPDRSQSPMLTPNKQPSLFAPDDSAFSPPKKSSPPWVLSSLLPPLLNYHLETLNDTQFPSILTVYLVPFFPSLFSPTLRTTAYLRAYHCQLTSLRLYADAAAFRKALAAHYRDLLSSLIYGSGKASLWCRNCSKPKKGDVADACTRCQERFASCGICEEDSPPPPESLWSHDLHAPKRKSIKHSKLWAWCQGCGHGGHSSCMRTWWVISHKGSSVPGDVSRGVCPIEGCGHDCMPGAERDKRRKEAEREKGRARGAVARDEWVAGESRAVEGARRLVGKEKPGGRRVRVLPPEGKGVGQR